MSRTTDASGSPSALVVALDGSERSSLAEALRPLGVDVRLAENFHDAKLAIAAEPPDLLITELRLGAYNGLHLVLRGRAVRPEMKAFVLTRTIDSVLQHEAARLGAELIVWSGDHEWLAAIVAGLVSIVPNGPPSGAGPAGTP